MAAFIRTGGVVSMTLSPPIDFIERQVGAFQERLADFTPLWERFANVLEGVETEQFASEGHGTWPELAPSTLREKQRLGFPADILVRTGELKKSLTDRQMAMRLTPATMSWGTDIPYARYHQEGTPRMPQRKVIEITVDDRRKLEATLVGWINQTAAETLRGEA